MTSGYSFRLPKNWVQEVAENPLTILKISSRSALLVNDRINSYAVSFEVVSSAYSYY